MRIAGLKLEYGPEYWFPGNSELFSLLGEANWAR